MRMLPPGWPPSWSLTGSMERQSYAGPPAALMASTNLAMVLSAATVPSSVAPLLSWISSRLRMSGVARFLTTAWASRSNLRCGSDGARFSTL